MLIVSDRSPFAPHPKADMDWTQHPAKKPMPDFVRDIPLNPRTATFTELTEQLQFFVQNMSALSSSLELFKERSGPHDASSAHIVRLAFGASLIRARATIGSIHGVERLRHLCQLIWKRDISFQIMRLIHLRLISHYNGIKDDDVRQMQVHDVAERLARTVKRHRKAPRTALTPVGLSDRKTDILAFLWKHNATSHATRQTQEEIAQGVLRPSSSANHVKRPIAELVKQHRLVKTKAGPNGGCWLSKKGAAYAATLS